MNEKPQRDVGVDIVRIIAILMIVIAHVVVTVYERSDFYGGGAWIVSLVVITVARLGVPLFFIISGYLLVQKERSFSQNVVHTGRRLLVPFLVWSTATYVDLYITHNLPQLNKDLILSGGGTEYYFLIGLAIIYLLNPIIRKVTKLCSIRELRLLLLVLGVSTIGQTIVSFSYHMQSFNIFNYWFFGLFYFIYGQYYRLFRDKARLSFKLSWLLFLSPLLVNLIVIYSLRLRGYTGDLFLESYFGPTVLISSLGLFNFIMSFSYDSIRKNFSKKLIIFSNLSFGVYLVHGILLDLILHKTIINPYGRVIVNLWEFLIISSFVTISGSYLFSYILNKNKFGKILIGQSNP